MKPADLSRALRAGFWPRLRDLGFETRTDRAAWRYLDGAVDVVDVWSMGPNADACGCTTTSFSAIGATIPSFLEPPPAQTVRDGRPRPRYWHCQLQVHMRKTIPQPWFVPFSASPNPRLAEPMLRHREALKSVLRRDRHDRPDIWFVLEDGSNLGEDVDDLWSVTSTVVVPLLDRAHDPCDAIELVADGQLGVNPGSPVADGIVHAARRVCPEA